MAVMLWILLLRLIHSFQGLSGAEHATLCTSNACFTLHTERLGFEKARQNCVHNGGYLMTVRDEAEEEVLHSLLWGQDKPLKCWIGLKLHRGNCVWAGKTLRGFKWVSGEEESHYSNWEKEPVITCTEDRCAKVHYTAAGQNQLKWTAGGCKSPASYACKFYFQGMCRPLALLGPGQVTYTAPFSEEPQRSPMQSYPLGTYADVSCSGGPSQYSVCRDVADAFRWTVPGPFCSTGKQNCNTHNGGCEHLCHQDAEEVRCVCKDGYELEEDGLTCRIKDLCGADTCEYRCVMRDSGYSCTCPAGLQLDANRRDCLDIDECRSQACQHVCVNTHGSYACVCHDGYEMVEGECIDVDECVTHQCQFRCVNTAGSFRCTCMPGFHVEPDGWTCAPDVTETPAAASDDPAEGGTQENSTESLARNTVELQHHPPHTDASLSHLQTDVPHLQTDAPHLQSKPPHLQTDVPPPHLVNVTHGDQHTDTPPLHLQTNTPHLQTDAPHLQTDAPHLQSNPPHLQTDAPPPHLVNVTHGDQHTNTSLVAGLAEAVNPRVIVCVLGSVIPLLLLVTVTLAIAMFRCSRPKKEAKKSTTTDGYCWVSSGLDPRLEKLYESILTDDL